ncbi:MAG: R3H domain-containing nucleic acid-binding protein [bacterium]
MIEKTAVSVNDIAIVDAKAASAGTWFAVEISEPHLYLSRNAEALAALNHLVRRIIEKNAPAKTDAERDAGSEIMIDINGFQKKRIEAIHAVAYMMAERARYFKSKIAIDPMPAFERRVVHEFLADQADVKTESEGTGSARHVVITYIGAI